MITQRYCPLPAFAKNIRQEVILGPVFPVEKKYFLLFTVRPEGWGCVGHRVRGAFDSEQNRCRWWLSENLFLEANHHGQPIKNL